MPAKTAILDRLGERAILLPALIDRALTANDRVKYLLTLLQAARDHALQPDREPRLLRQERTTCGLGDASLDEVVSACERVSDTVVRMPGARQIHATLVDEVRVMLEPLAVSDVEPHVAAAYRCRLDRLLEAVPSLDGDCIPIAYIDALGRAEPEGDDSVHLLVMELHRALNELQRHIATESIDGASVYAIAEGDRPLVSAFMAGVNATAPLKFDHQGLNTSATRSHDRLVIQNDLGTTDNHVVVLHVTALTLTLTYSDAHRARLEFFQRILDHEGFQWAPARPSPAPGEYQLLVGTVAAPGAAELRQHLTAVGSTLVFLIDWNRARKRLSRFVKKSDAIDVLRWAADHRVGHRAFLQLGDVALVSTALERAVQARMPVGARLDEVLGRDSARRFLQAVLRLCAEGLLTHKSTRLIQDEIHAELLTHFETSEQSALALAADHAALVVSLASLVRDAAAEADVSSEGDRVRGLAARAKVWESRADELVRRACLAVHHASIASALARLLSEADDAADALEEAAFLLTMMAGRAGDPSTAAPLQALAALVARGAQAYVTCVEAARDAHPVGAREAIEEFLVAVDRVIAFEHESDEQERAAEAEFVAAARDFRELHVLSKIVGCLGDAADALARCAVMLRDDVLQALNTR